MLALIYRTWDEDAKPDLITLNSLLNACAFTNYVDDEKATTTVHGAINAFDIFVEEDLETTNHVIYGSLLMVLTNSLKMKMYKLM